MLVKCVDKGKTPKRGKPTLNEPSMHIPSSDNVNPFTVIKSLGNTDNTSVHDNVKTPPAPRLKMQKSA